MDPIVQHLMEKYGLSQQEAEALAPRVKSGQQAGSQAIMTGAMKSVAEAEQKRMLAMQVYGGIMTKQSSGQPLNPQEQAYLDRINENLKARLKADAQAQLPKPGLVMDEGSVSVTSAGPKNPGLTVTPIPPEEQYPLGPNGPTQAAIDAQRALVERRRVLQANQPDAVSGAGGVPGFRVVPGSAAPLNVAEDYLARRAQPEQPDPAAVREQEKLNKRREELKRMVEASKLLSKKD